MPREKLTQKRVDRATPPPGQRKLDLFDTDCKGLVVEVRHSGKSYFLRYSSAHKRTCQRKLADTDHLTLAEARKLARERLAQIALGEDPFAPPEESRKRPRSVRSSSSATCRTPRSTSAAGRPTSVCCATTCCPRSVTPAWTKSLVRTSWTSSRNTGRRTSRRRPIASI